jgi:hypothetical protein
MTNCLRDDVYAELEAALKARRAGNEGMARVCARRAAGWAIGHVHQRLPNKGQKPNAYQLLRWYGSRKDAPAALRQAALRLTRRITKEHEHPHRKDPLEDAEALVRAMFAGHQET